MIPRKEKQADFGNHLHLEIPFPIALLSGSWRAEKQITVNFLFMSKGKTSRQYNKMDTELLERFFNPHEPESKESTFPVLK